MRTDLIIKGIHCTSCKVLIEDICFGFKEIKKCEVDVKSGKVIVEHQTNFDPQKIKKEIEKIGEYRVIVQKPY